MCHCLVPRHLQGAGCAGAPLNFQLRLDLQRNLPLGKETVLCFFGNFPPVRRNCTQTLNLHPPPTPTPKSCMPSPGPWLHGPKAHDPAKVQSIYGPMGYDVAPSPPMGHGPTGPMVVELLKAPRAGLVGVSILVPTLDLTCQATYRETLSCECD